MRAIHSFLREAWALEPSCADERTPSNAFGTWRWVAADLRICGDKDGDHICARHKAFIGVLYSIYREGLAVSHGLSQPLRTVPLRRGCNCPTRTIHRPPCRRLNSPQASA
jgi:hypothetical protein